MQELSLNVLDVAQNSVAAGADIIRITEEHLSSGRLIITIEDNGCGMNEQQLREVTDPFFTTRTTRKVGLGIPLFKMAAEMTGGSFSIQSAEGSGTRVEAVFDTTHLDCMPIGDMCSSFCSLVQCNPHIDFVYRLITPKGEMEADTAQFRAVLEDIPLSSPEVLSFIGDFIQQNSGEIL